VPCRLALVAQVSFVHHMAYLFGQMLEAEVLSNLSDGFSDPYVTPKCRFTDFVDDLALVIDADVGFAVMPYLAILSIYSSI